jgi:hypothetical protein
MNMPQLIHHEKKMSLKQYRKMKRQVLKEFCIKLTDEQKAHMDGLKNEIQIDQFCLSLIMNNGN